MTMMEGFKCSNDNSGNCLQKMSRIVLKVTFSQLWRLSQIVKRHLVPPLQ